VTTDPGPAPRPRPGQWFPLGATPVEGGVNFAVTATDADAVDLCLFDPEGHETRVPLPERDGGVWHGMVAGLRPGQAYGYRATGPYDPGRGLRMNPAKLLIDPYARALDGAVRFGPEVLGYRNGDPDIPSDDDSGPWVPKSLVVGTGFRWRHPKPTRRYADSVIYEVHVKGFTMTHPGVPEELRGTYAGLAHEAALSHLVDLGVTAVELLPVHESCCSPSSWSGPVRAGRLQAPTIGYFAPHQGYSAAVRAGAPGGQVAEFQAMVDALHAAGLEVLLDVVFNHTAESSEVGPTLSFRGLDNRAYYRLADDGRHYVDTTGCGNSLNAGDPVTLALIMDSLRYWTTEMGVDGFRFDLAPTLARQDGGFDQVSAFFDLVSQDPVVSRTKLIAEPWDVGQTDSYDLGRFPPLWREWNGKYRDTVRDFWRGTGGAAPDFATRFAGSSDLYAGAGRRPTSSVNLVTVHDGFTLADLVSYDGKHNQANGEDNRDGTDDNRSWNSGAEGPTTDPAVVELRARRSRSLLATLMLSFGMPMLLGGDELGRTQQGNNNAYCQDNPLTWFDWASVDRELLGFTRGLITFRKAHPAFRRRRFLAGVEADYLRWLTPAGEPMTGSDWDNPATRCLAIYVDGRHDPDHDAEGRPLLDDEFLVMVNGWKDPVDFVIRQVNGTARWSVAIDTSWLPSASDGDGNVRLAGDRTTVVGYSLVVFRGLGAATEASTV
jgi:isoamylase